MSLGAAKRSLTIATRSSRMSRDGRSSGHLDASRPSQSRGADPTEKSRIAFARYKGEAENALLAAGFHAVYSFRPAYIYPVKPRKEPNLGYRLLRAIYPVFRMLFPSQVLRADDLARVMVDVAVRGIKERGASVFENNDIQAMVEWLRHLTR